MKSADSRSSAPLFWVPLVLVLLALGLRLLKLESPGTSLLPNFSPWMALVFTGTLVFRQGTLPWWSWPLLLLGVDLIGMGSQLWSYADGRAEVFLTYGLYALAAWVASRLRGRLGVMQTLLGMVVCSTLFYLLTNTLSWWVAPYYTKDLQGLVQALTTGLPAFPPTWTFFRNSLLSDLGFSALLLAAFNAEAKARSIQPMRWATA